MKVAVISSTYPPYRGGMGNVAAEEVGLLKARGHDVTVLAPDVGVEPLFKIGNAACVPELYTHIDGFDAVHLHYPFFGGAEYVAWKKFWHKDFRFVMTYHMDVVGRGAMRWIFALYTRLVLPSLLRGAERVLVSSLDYARTSPILSRHWAVVEPKLVEIPFPAPVDPRIKFADEAQGAYFVFVGGLDSAHYFKGMEGLLRALGPHELHVIGDGNVRPRYEALARELGIQDRVKFLGALPHGEEFSREVAGARALVLPSVDRSEAFGLVLLEALAHGIPMIASDLPGVRTVATDAVALRVAPGDVAGLARALDRMASDHALRASLVANIPEALKRYRTDDYVRALEVSLSPKL